MANVQQGMSNVQLGEAVFEHWTFLLWIRIACLPVGRVIPYCLAGRSYLQQPCNLSYTSSSARTLSVSCPTAATAW